MRPGPASYHVTSVELLHRSGPPFPYLQSGDVAHCWVGGRVHGLGAEAGAVEGERLLIAPSYRETGKEVAGLKARSWVLSPHCSAPRGPSAAPMKPLPSFGVKIKHRGLPVVAQQVTNPTSIHEDVGSMPGLAQWVKDPALP